MENLTKDVALVTGASKNIGKEIALTLASSGIDIACIFQYDAKSAEEVVKEINRLGRKAKMYQLDLRESSSVLKTINDIYEDFGHIDILVNNAAIRPKSKIEDVTSEEWDHVFEVNLKSPFFLSQAVIPKMREKRWGRIINIGGISAYTGTPQRPHVIASKLGVVGLTRALANETARWGITVNTIVPGIMDTSRENPEWYGDLEKFYQEKTDQIPAARLGNPKDVANTCLFLASDNATYITGQEIFVTGGMYPLTRQIINEYD
jgi:3-oxoacyl-[acyl-carrier protein] reductase